MNACERPPRVPARQGGRGSIPPGTPVRGPPLGFGIAAEFSDHAADRTTTRRTRGGKVGLDVGQPVLPCTQTVSFPPATPRVKVALNGLDLIRD